jgi:lipoate-protein ligase B
VTLGRRHRPEHLLASPAELARRGIALFEVSRGGDATYHGPGQLVGYLIADLSARGEPDVQTYLRRLEAALRSALGRLGVRSRRLPGATGVFVDDPLRPEPPRKLASIGVGLRGWVTSHGFALNVTLDPADFDVIVPCGLHHVAMTSVARELGAAAPADLPQRALREVATAFRARFGAGSGPFGAASASLSRPAGTARSAPGASL